MLAALLGALLGAALGAVLALALTGRSRGARPAAGPLRDGGPGPLPSGAADVLAVVGGPSVVLDAADEVVRASPAALAAGLVHGASLAHPQLLALARAARDDGGTHQRRMALARGPLTGVDRVVLDVSAAPLGPAHVLLLATDHTESARLEEMRRDFVVNVSHELKTPVGALSLLAEAVEEAAEDPVAVHRFAARMGVETRRLTQLVRDIVDLSQLQGRDVVADPARVDLAACVEEAVDRCRLTAAARGVAVDVVTAGAAGAGVLDAGVYGDGEQLTTAVANLVDNAVRYSEPGTRVAVGVGRRDSLVEVTVKDQGIGIPPAEQQRVFERFYRVDPARSRATGGTGLGLSIVKHVMARHGGDVHLWSQVGQGSTFTLRLPDRAAGPAPAGPAPGGSAPGGATPATPAAGGSAGPERPAPPGARTRAREGVEAAR